MIYSTYSADILINAFPI